MRGPNRFLCLALVALAGCRSESAVTSAPPPVVIYVAASAKSAVEEIAKKFQTETGFSVEVSPGSSSRLAKQIVEGGPADIFISADQVNADLVKAKGLVAERRNLLGNRLAVVTPADSKLTLKTLTDLGGAGVTRLALALEKVPAGEYARQALRKAGAWEQVKDKLVGGEDVRATLAFVEQGADAGIVYRTDVFGNSKVKTAFEVDAALHQPIEYPLVLLQRGNGTEPARRFYAYLASEPAAEVFRRVQFVVLK